MAGFGRSGQRRLGRARVLVVGAGGLGCAACTYLAAAGVGVLRVVDRGEVALSNLNRQVLYCAEDIGKAKVDRLRARLRRLNPGVHVEAHHATLDARTIAVLLDNIDVVVDALDNVPSRRLLNRACVRRGLPLVHGAVHGMQGQVMTVTPGRGPCLACLFRAGHRSGVVPVVGTIAGIVGCIEATETIKIITGVGTPLRGRLLLIDGADMRTAELEIPRDPACPHCRHLVRTDGGPLAGEAALDADEGAQSQLPVSRRRNSAMN